MDRKDAKKCEGRKERKNKEGVTVLYGGQPHIFASFHRISLRSL